MSVLLEETTNVEAILADRTLAYNFLLRNVESVLIRDLLTHWVVLAESVDSIGSIWPKVETHISLKAAQKKFKTFLDSFSSTVQLTMDGLNEYLLDQAAKSYTAADRNLKKSIPSDVAEAKLNLEFTSGFTPMSKRWIWELVHAPSPWDGKTILQRFRYLDASERRRLSQILVSALASGEGFPTISARVRSAIRVSASKAETIARSEIMRVSNTSALSAYRKNKAVAGVQIIATLDRVTCVICGAHDRTRWYYEGTPSVNDAPSLPVHPRCRCFYSPISRLWKRLGIEPPFTTRASVYGPVDYKLDYRSWLKRMEKRNTGFALGILGPTRYELWTRGLPIGSMVSRIETGGQISGRILTLDELEAAIDELL